MEVPTKTNNGLEPQEVFSLNLSSLNEKVLYFILKTKTYESIKISQEQGIWRVPIRKQNIQPFYVLNLAFEVVNSILFQIYLKISTKFRKEKQSSLSFQLQIQKNGWVMLK